MLQILTPSRLTIAAAWLLLAGCGSSATPQSSPAAPAGQDSPTTAQRALDTSGARGLPGPPGSTPAPTSTDPARRVMEDRLYRTDGGRVVLKGIRAHGGWKRWLEVKEIQAAIKTVSVKGPDGQVPAAPSEPQAVIVRPSDPFAVPASEEERILIAPFWLASPLLSLEYLGVESAAATGETLDKVQVFQTRPGTDWLIVYFNRHTGTIERILKPAFTREDPLRFKRIDLREPREVEGLWFSTLWRTFSLETRFARPDPRQPDLLREVEVHVTLKPAGSPTPAASD